MGAQSRSREPSPKGLGPTGFDRGEFAKFSQRRNDMYWSIWDAEDGFIRWTGYDDAHWWSQIATTDQFRVRKGMVSGRTYRLDPDTTAVEISETTNDRT